LGCSDRGRDKPTGWVAGAPVGGTGLPGADMGRPFPQAGRLVGGAWGAG
jgi:hypothetical protein